jgi:hypothetical protein
MTTHTNRSIAALALGLCAVVGGCGTARSVDAYRMDTEKLLQTRNDQVKSCYDQALQSNHSLAGTVAVRFVVDKSSGVFEKASVDAAQTTAPATLGDCVVHAVDGLKLAPGDRNEGHATFTYDFKPTPAS